MCVLTVTGMKTKKDGDRLWWNFISGARGGCLTLLSMSVLLISPADVCNRRTLTMTL